MIDTGSTLSLAAPLLKAKGASKVYALISHGESIHLHMVQGIKMRLLPHIW